MLDAAVQRLVIVRGPGHPDKTELARTLAAGLAGKSVVIAFADLAERWIITPGENREAEHDLCYRMLKLLVISYLKEGYSVVVDAPYVASVDGRMAARDSEVTDLVRLARMSRPARAAVVTMVTDAVRDAQPDLAAAFHRDVVEDELRVTGGGGDLPQLAAGLLPRIIAL